MVKQYDGKTVVDSVSFEIPKGKVTSLIGLNGAGKSTVMSILSRLIMKDSGIVNLDGRSIEKWKSKELSKHLAILTQSNNIQMKLTVREWAGEQSDTPHAEVFHQNRVPPEHTLSLQRALMETPGKSSFPQRSRKR